MPKNFIEIPKDLKKYMQLIIDNGYECYLVGGAVRDHLINVDNKDFDFCTNIPFDKLKKLIPNITIMKENDHRNTAIIRSKGLDIEFSTYRGKDLKEDLFNRDFTINAIAVDVYGNIIDYYYGVNSVSNKTISLVDPLGTGLVNDPLRILRAIRFATTLNFTLEPKLKTYIKKYANTLKKLSKDRKKEELDLIFSSPNKAYGIELLINLKLADALDIPNLKKAKITPSMIVTWAQLNALDKYNFNVIEKESINKINEIKDKNLLDNHTLYNYGLYICTMAAELKDIDKRQINKIYASMPIKTRLDIALSPTEICEILKKEAGPFLKPLLSNLENEILDGNIKNTKEDITRYILNE